MSPTDRQSESSFIALSPERLDSWKDIAAYLGRSVLTAQRWEKSEGLPVHRHAHAKQASVYAFRSEIDHWRHGRDADVPAERESHERDRADLVADGVRFSHWWRGRHLHVSGATFVVVVLLAGIVPWRARVVRTRWAREQALPRIERLTSGGFSNRDYLAAYRLAMSAEQYIARDARMDEAWRKVARRIDVSTDPAGADVFITSGDESDTVRLGTAPLRQIRVPRGFAQWKVRKAGYVEVGGMLDGLNGSLHVVLDRNESVPEGMVRATGGTFHLLMAHLGTQASFELGDYWIDRYEVTNREFKRFVDAGGYSDSRYWKERFDRGGHELQFADAMRLFRDRTGRSGPATWVAGDFPQGKGDYPVAGVSWFEAMAYANFAGKSLPTIFHWARAAGTWAGSEVVPRSNFAGEGPVAVGQSRAMSVVGAYDMAGNVKEWCMNAADEKRFILGGAWNDPLYMFAEADAQSPFARGENFGFRTAKYITPPAPSQLVAVDFPRRDFSKEKPVSDAVFGVIRGLYMYDRIPLRAATDAVDDSNEHWRKETISFDAAYGGERMTAMLFIPRHVRPPYQTVIFFPGSDVIQKRSSRDLQPPWGGAIVESGRALVIPVYKGTFERGDALDSDYPVRTDFYREHVLAWYKDVGRTLDYVETRSDLDASRIAYVGFSWGARLGPIFLALDPRLKVAALVGGGLKFARTFPEVDPFNFASRVTVPVLMVNGRYDFFFPLETSQQPLLELLATSGRDKRHVVLNAGHAPPVTPTVTEMLRWMDRYLGAVTVQP